MYKAIYRGPIIPPFITILVGPPRGVPVFPISCVGATLSGSASMRWITSSKTASMPALKTMGGLVNRGWNDNCVGSGWVFIRQAKTYGRGDNNTCCYICRNAISLYQCVYIVHGQNENRFNKHQVIARYPANLVALQNIVPMFISIKTTERLGHLYAIWQSNCVNLDHFPKIEGVKVQKF